MCKWKSSLVLQITQGSGYWNVTKPLRKCATPRNSICAFNNNGVQYLLWRSLPPPMKETEWPTSGRTYCSCTMVGIVLLKNLTFPAQSDNVCRCESTKTSHWSWVLFRLAIKIIIEIFKNCFDMWKAHFKTKSIGFTPKPTKISFLNFPRSVNLYIVQIIIWLHKQLIKRKRTLEIFSQMGDHLGVKNIHWMRDNQASMEQYCTFLTGPYGRVREPLKKMQHINTSYSLKFLGQRKAEFH